VEIALTLRFRRCGMTEGVVARGATRKRYDGDRDRLSTLAGEGGGPVDPRQAQSPSRAEPEEVCEQLEDEHACYLDLFESAPDAYMTTDERGVIREANRAAATLLGMPQEMLPGKLLVAFVARRDTRAFRDQLGTARRSRPHAFSIKLRPRGGVPFTATLSVRTGRRGGVDQRELRWTIRSDEEEKGPAAHGNLLAGVAAELRGSRSPGSVEVVPEQTTWAIARLLSIVQGARIRGWLSDPCRSPGARRHAPGLPRQGRRRFDARVRGDPPRGAQLECAVRSPVEPGALHAYCYWPPS
jgi:PAS domain S-box-containing protein